MNVLKKTFAKVKQFVCHSNNQTLLVIKSHKFVLLRGLGYTPSRASPVSAYSIVLIEFIALLFNRIIASLGNILAFHAIYMEYC